MEKRLPLAGEFMLTTAWGPVEIATVEHGLVYLKNRPNQPISISSVTPSEDNGPCGWVLFNEGV